MRKKFSFLFLALLVISLFFTETVKTLPTIGILGFLLTAILRTDYKEIIASKNHNKAFLIFIIIFIFYGTGILSLEDGISLSYWKNRFIVKIPFLLLPTALLLTSSFSRKHYFTLYYIFFIVTLLTAVGSIINYINNYEEINLLIRTSKALPVITNHVRYSLFVCFSIFIAWKLHNVKFYILSKHELWTYKIGGIFLIVFLHIAAVRSGLIAFYGMSSLVVLYQIILKEKRYKFGITILLLIIITPWLAFISLTSIQKKVENMKDDLGNIDIEKRANNYSLTARWYSYKVGAAVIKNNKWVGVGIANFESAIENEYETNYPKILKEQPHNQYIYWLGSFGALGTVILLIIFYFPLLWNNQYQKSFLLLIHYLIVSLSFLVENTIETQLGANFIIIFCLIPFLYDNENETVKPT